MSSDLTRAVRALQLASHEADRAVARRLGLGPNDLAALQVLTLAPDPIGPVELGHRLGIRSASATVLVDRLQRSGHVERTPDDQDKRRVTVAATEHSWDEVRASLAPLLAAMDDVADRLDEHDRAVVAHFLAETAAVLTRFAERAPLG